MKFLEENMKFNFDKSGLFTVNMFLKNRICLEIEKY